MFLGTLGDLLSSQKTFQKVYEEIVDNKFILVAHVGQGQNWGSKRTLKILKIRKFEIQTSISPGG